MSAADGTITLRTGTSIPEADVETTWTQLAALAKSDPFGLYEVVMLARDPGHIVSKKYGVVIEDFGLSSDGKMHDATRGIVLAATEGEGLEVYLVDPVTPRPQR